MNKTILITGGAGFIGSHVVRLFVNKYSDYLIVNLDKLTYAGNLENLEDVAELPNYNFEKGDITDHVFLEALFQKYNFDGVIHLAAESHVDRSILGPAAFVETNIMGTFQMLEAARKVWLEEKKLGADDVRFHHISTDEVYGTLAPDDPPFEEETPYTPNSPYAASKASSDHLVRSYIHTYGLPATLTNCTNNYGPYQFPDKLIPVMILNALAGKDLPIYGDGMQIRDWLYVEDHAEAIWLVLQQGRTGESYCIGGNNQPPNIEIVDTICEILDELKPSASGKPYAKQKTFVQDRPGHDRRYAMKIDKIHEELGWQPKHNLKDGLIKTIRWYLQEEEWIDAIQKQLDYQAWMDKNYAKRDEE